MVQGMVFRSHTTFPWWLASKLRPRSVGGGVMTLDYNMVDEALQRVIYDYPAIEGARWFVREQRDGSLVLWAEEPRRGQRVYVSADYLNSIHDIRFDRVAMQAVVDRWNQP